MARSDYPLIWNSMFVYEVEFSSVIRGHHVYDREELDKEHNEYAVGLTLKPGLEADNKYVGHVPMGLSFLIFPIFIFLKLAKVPVKVTGSRRQENGLVVPGSFLTRTTSRVMIRTTKFEEEIIRLKSLCTHMDIKKARKGKERGSLFPSLHESPLPSPHPPPPTLPFYALHRGWKRFVWMRAATV